MDHGEWLYDHMEEIGMFDIDESYIFDDYEYPEGHELKPEEYYIDPEMHKGFMMLIKGQEIPPDMLARIKETRIKRNEFYEKRMAELEEDMNNDGK